VSLRTALSTRASVDASITASAPSDFAIASFAATLSTAITRAPAATATCTMLSPMPPQPNTTTQSPGAACARRTTAWYGVVTASARIDPSTSGTPSGITNASLAGATTNSA